MSRVRTPSPAPQNTAMSKTSNALGQLLVVIPLGCATISAPAARPPIGDDLAITCIAASPKGALVAVGESDGSVITIDVGTHDWK